MSKDQEFNQEKYNIPEADSFYIDKDKNELKKMNEMSVIEKIKVLAKKLGYELKEKPRSGCKHCFGRGYEGYRKDTNEPVICRCMFKSQPFNPFAKENLINLNRKQKRQMQSARSVR